MVICWRHGGDCTLFVRLGWLILTRPRDYFCVLDGQYLHWFLAEGDPALAGTTSSLNDDMSMG